MIEQVADADALCILRKSGENIRQAGVILQLAVMDEQHDSHRGKLFCYRCQPEVGMLADRAQTLKVSDPIPALEGDVPVLYDEYGGARSLPGLQ